MKVEADVCARLRGAAARAVLNKSIGGVKEKGTGSESCLQPHLHCTPKRKGTQTKTEVRIGRCGGGGNEGTQKEG